MLHVVGSFAPTPRVAAGAAARLIELVTRARREQQFRPADCASPRWLTCEAQRGSSRTGARAEEVRGVAVGVGVPPSGYASSVVLT